MDEADGFSAFMARRHLALVRSAFLLTGDRGHAEDLVQAALLRTFLAWDRLDDIAKAEAYTRTVMARLAIRWARRRWRGERASATLYPSPVPDVKGGVDTTDQVLRCLASLPAAQRAVLVLRYFDQLSEVEIAARLRCSPGTVKSRASRALSTLRVTGLLDDPRPIGVREEPNHV